MVTNLTKPLGTVHSHQKWVLLCQPNKRIISLLLLVGDIPSFLCVVEILYPWKLQSVEIVPLGDW